MKRGKVRVALEKGMVQEGSRSTQMCECVMLGSSLSGGSHWVTGARSLKHRALG